MLESSLLPKVAAFLTSNVSKRTLAHMITPLVYGADPWRQPQLCDWSCFTLPALSAKGGRLETSKYPKGLVGAYQDSERAELPLC